MGSSCRSSGTVQAMKRAVRIPRIVWRCHKMP